MELYDQIRKMSFIFFLAIGLAHFLSGFLSVKGYFVPISGLMNRVLFIPFVLSIITYATANAKYHLAQSGKDAPWITYACIACGVLIFLGLLAIELFLPDSASPLIPL